MAEIVDAEDPALVEVTADLGDGRLVVALLRRVAGHLLHRLLAIPTVGLFVAVLPYFPQWLHHPSSAGALPLCFSFGCHASSFPTFAIASFGGLAAALALAILLPAASRAIVERADVHGRRALRGGGSGNAARHANGDQGGYGLAELYGGGKRLHLDLGPELWQGVGLHQCLVDAVGALPEGLLGATDRALELVQLILVGVELRPERALQQTESWAA